MVVTAEHILEDLNEPQRAAVTTIANPLLILAGPGSGKTRVIAHRIAYLVDVIGVAPWRVLAVTFTNKASREMRSRVTLHLGEAASDLMLGTFHSICARLLRTESERIGLNRSFNIYDDSDQMNLMKRACERSNVDTKRFKERAILSAISRAKSELVTPEEYARTARDYFGEVVARVYDEYQRLLGENAAMDFDDLLTRTVQMLQEHEEIREKYQERFLHVLVDEFQDTNIAQYQLAKLFAGKHPNICVVGDPDQSIYSWRSADIRNILNFERDYPNAKTVLLEQNYRSTQNILDAAHSVIAGNKHRKEKELWTESGGGEPVTVYEAYDEAEEADFVANEITTLIGEGQRPWGDFAVMYRTNAQSRALEEALIRAKVPYALVGGTRFYERREVKDILAYLRLVQNPYDVVSFTRVVNVPGRGIGAKSMAELERWSREREVPLYTALQLMRDQEQAAVRPGPQERHPIGSKQTTALLDFLAMIDELQDVAAKNNLSTLLDGIMERTSYRRYLYDEFDEGEADERWENIGELRNVASEYDGLAAGHGLVAFLEDVALISDADTVPEAEAGSGRVTLITLHSAKGLEYPVVFMIAMEEGVLPHIRSFDDPLQMEEERRLAYVGMTRAKQRLYLLRAFKRYGMGASTHNPASRFLKDIPQRLIAQRSAVRSQYEAVERGPSRFREEFQKRDERPPVPEELVYAGGERVRHPRFGEGVVVASQMVKDDQEVTIAFKGEVGIKKLMLSFAPLEKL